VRPSTFNASQLPHFLVNIIWLLILLGAGTSGCPDGWIPYAGNWYKFNLVKKTQSAARTDCQSQGGELTSIIDASELAIIASIVYVLLFDVSFCYHSLHVTKNCCKGDSPC